MRQGGRHGIPQESAHDGHWNGRVELVRDGERHQRGNFLEVEATPVEARVHIFLGGDTTSQNGAAEWHVRIVGRRSTRPQRVGAHVRWDEPALQRKQDLVDRGDGAGTGNQSVCERMSGTVKL